MIAEAHDKDLLTLIIFIVTNKIKNLIEEEMDEFTKKYGKDYTIKSEPSDYIHEGLNSAQFISHLTSDVKSFAHRLLKTAFEECDAEDDRNIPKNCSREVCESCAEMKGYNASNQAHREKQEQLLESLNPPQGN
jgi:hypothetical protein